MPLLVYALFATLSLSLTSDQMFLIACVLTMISLFVLGAIKSRFSVKPWWRGGMEIMVMGSFTAASAYGIGWFVNAVALGGSAAGAGHR